MERATQRPLLFRAAPWTSGVGIGAWPRSCMGPGSPEGTESLAPRVVFRDVAPAPKGCRSHNSSDAELCVFPGRCAIWVGLLLGPVAQISDFVLIAVVSWVDVLLQTAYAARRAGEAGQAASRRRMRDERQVPRACASPLGCARSALGGRRRSGRGAVQVQAAAEANAQRFVSCLVAISGRGSPEGRWRDHSPPRSSKVCGELET